MATLHQRKTHPTYVEGCFGCKVSTQRIGYCGQGGQDLTRQKAWDRELDLYASAVKAGIQPETTQASGIRKSIEWSEKTGVAYSTENKLDYDTNTVLERYAV
jgi:hypothetical protein